MKRITFDTNVFLHNLDIVNSKEYSEYEKIVLLPVIAELDNIKVNSTNVDLKHRGRKATKHILKLIENGNIKPLFVMDNECLNEEIIPLNRYDVIDDLIINMCQSFGITLVTMDYNVYLKCLHLNVDCKLVKGSCEIENLSTVYKGKKEFHVDFETIDEIYRKGSITADLKPAFQYDELDSIVLNENEFVTLINGKTRALTIHKDGALHLIKYDKNTSFWGLKPRSEEQRYALELLNNDDIRIVTMTGKAGSSKSILSLAVGLEKKVNHNSKGRLYIAKPPVSLSKRLQLGFKKGTTLDKAIGTLGSYTSNMERLCELKDSKVDGAGLLVDLIEQCKVSYLNLEDILGMSFSDDDYIIIDEAELLTKDEMKAVVTRGGKLVVIGDCEQGGDNKIDYENSGLLHLINVGKSSKLIGHITLEQCYRSAIVDEINNLWEGCNVE